MMSCKVFKWNKYSWQQERNFVITNHHIYNFNKKSKYHFVFVNICISDQLRRSIAIKSLSGLTKNMQKDSQEFIIHVENEPDYRLTCD
jgi:hypothetical protein